MREGYKLSLTELTMAQRGMQALYSEETMQEIEEWHTAIGESYQ